jgi:hypothetical protein
MESAHVRTTAQQILSKEAAASAWSAGQAMTLEETMAYALAEKIDDESSADSFPRRP